MTIQLTDTVWAVGVPKQARDFYINGYGDALCYYSIGLNPDFETIPQGRWQIIGLYSQLTKEQAYVIMKDRCANSCRWPKCDSLDCMEKDTAAWAISNLKSLDSLMKSKGAYRENPYGEKKPFIDAHKMHLEGDEACMNEVRQWQFAQAKVFEDWILIEKQK